MSDHERIYLDHYADDELGRQWHTRPVFTKATEYVRADLVAAELAEARDKALEEAAVTAESNAELEGEPPSHVIASMLMARPVINARAATIATKKIYRRRHPRTEGQAMSDEFQDEKPFLALVKIARAITTDAGNKSAEVDRYRTALSAIIDRSNNGDLGTSKVNDMRKIAQEALGK
ncbi:hypothetical protein GOZ96_04995 [Agrobacterium vitis]|uniref:Terminase small subunit n=1 Tax=Agrobacterium vitis TaxID=373 RepID=A0A7J4WX58_AGRVI|nr:hypothetical protein [Agrobacterium vitis]KAA3518869.1 hypothetical protein DXT89_26735 [Agrobacterium vitis]MUZ95946.1 hypothetical protein [Agrobacterium vitis]